MTDLFATKVLIACGVMWLAQKIGPPKGQEDRSRLFTEANRKESISIALRTGIVVLVLYFAGIALYTSSFWKSSLVLLPAIPILVGMLIVLVITLLLIGILWRLFKKLK